MSLDSQSAHASPLAEAASAYIRAGFKIFPVFGLRFENGKLVCACGNPSCASPCKHPATAHGLKDATADFDTFVALCNGRRGMNVGVSTDGYVAVDVDPGKGGAVAWAKVSTELQLDAAIDGTPQARSGGGGSHVIWRAPNGAQIRNGVSVLGPGVDIRATGGYLVAPPSLHISGNRYRWIEGHSPEEKGFSLAPPELLARIAAAQNGTGSNGHRTHGDGEEEIREGSRNDQLYRLARSLRAKKLDPSSIRLAVRQENQAKCRPPLEEREVEAIISNALRQPNEEGFEQNSTNAEPFLGFLNVEQVRERLTALADGLRNDLNIAYSNEYVDAAAALEHFEPAEFARLGIRLKNRGLGVSRWDRAIRERSRQQRERLADSARAAKASQHAAKLPAGQGLGLHEPEPWAGQVDGATLLNDIETTIKRFAIVSQDALVAISLWIVFAHMFDIFDVAPRLSVESPVMRCGKSTLLELVTYLVPRALACSNISPAAIYRTIEAVRPTLLMDEVDALINARGTEGTEELRGILNSGHTRATGFVIRLVGDNHEPRRFSTFTPIVTAMIGRLPPTLRDRSIPIGMKRKLPTETVEKLRGKHKLANIATLRELAQKVARWASDNRDQIRQSDPEVPHGLDDRAADNWTPLLAIAEAVRGEWASRARAAAQGLSGAEAASESHGILLLKDLRDLFKLECAWTLADGKEVKRLSSISICKALAGMEHRPWAEFGKTHDHITPTRLADLLRPFGIIPSTIELADKTTAKGYKLEDLKEVFSRYLPDIEVSSRQHVKSVGGEGKPATSQDVSADRADVSENTLKRHGERGFDGLTGEKVGFGSSAGKEDVGEEELA